MASREHFAWVEKYRPQTLDDCILPEAVKQTFAGILAKKDTPNLLLYGPPGTGKTTIAKALCAMLGVDVLVINASDIRGIDLIRNHVKDFASSMSFGGRRKYVLLDEADNLTKDAQIMLRAFIEEFSLQCGFIFTANHPSRIIPPLHSRCSLVDFRIPQKQRQGIAITFAKRVMKILATEKVVFDQQVVLGAVQMFFPDFRRTLNELQRYSASGTLSEAILSQMSDNDVAVLVTALKSNEYDLIQKWVDAHPDIDEFAFYHMVYEKLLDKAQPDSLTTVILLANDYSWKSSLAADKQLNVLACLRELQVEGRFT